MPVRCSELRHCTHPSSSSVASSSMISPGLTLSCSGSAGSAAYGCSTRRIILCVCARLAARSLLDVERVRAGRPLPQPPRRFSKNRATTRAPADRGLPMSKKNASSAPEVCARPPPTSARVVRDTTLAVWLVATKKKKLANPRPRPRAGCRALDASHPA